MMTLTVLSTLTSDITWNKQNHIESQSITYYDQDSHWSLSRLHVNHRHISTCTARCWNCIEMTHYHCISTHTLSSSCKYSAFTDQTSQSHLIACIISLPIHLTDGKDHRNTIITYYCSSVFHSLALDLRRRWTYIYTLVQSMDLLSKADDRLLLPDVVETTGPACDWCTAKMTKVHNNKQYTVNDFMMSVMKDVENGVKRAEWCRLIRLH